MNVCERHVSQGKEDHVMVYGMQPTNRIGANIHLPTSTDFVNCEGQ
jgi:hypothetical protein